MEAWRINDLVEIKNDWKKLAQEQTKEIEKLQKEVEFWKDLAESCECNNDNK